MKPFLPESGYPMKYFRPEVKKKKAGCQLQILRCEANCNENFYCYNLLNIRF